MINVDTVFDDLVEAQALDEDATIVARLFKCDPQDIRAFWSCINAESVFRMQGAERIAKTIADRFNEVSVKRHD